ncbi:MAG: hypothetical protein MJE12_09065 [Alphaproteobacteria bacterium]|nr:hypothetical protein [Alphaproteobacteria bacterium]
MSTRVDLIENGATTGPWKPWPGGPGVFMARGTFSGATVRLQVLFDDTALDISGGDVDLTGAGVGGFFLPPCQIRAEVENGPPSGIFATALGD